MAKESNDWRELARDLIQHINTTNNWMAWINKPLGSVFYDHNLAVADIFALYKRYENPEARVYELKMDRQDFLNDVRSLKYMRSLPHCSQFYYAAPEGIAKKEEVPTDCGLIVKGGKKGWHVTKAAPHREWKPDTTFLLSLIMRRERELERGPIDRVHMTAEQIEVVDLEAFGKRFGHKIARQIAEGKKLVPELEELRLKVNRITNRKCEDLGDAVSWLRSDIEHLISERGNIREVMDLHRVAAWLNDSSYFGHYKIAIETLKRVLGELEARNGKKETQ